MALGDTVMPFHEWVRKYLHYDPETGHLTWIKCPTNRVKVGMRAGTAMTQDYYVIGIKGRVRKVSRVIWLWVTGEWPSDEVDHINGNRSDDRWSNLRLATHAQNLRNRGKQKNNTSGYKGVHLHKATGKWRARIKKDRHVCLGLYDTPEEAHAAYCEAARQLHGEFAHS